MRHALPTRPSRGRRALAVVLATTTALLGAALPAAGDDVVDDEPPVLLEAVVDPTVAVPELGDTPVTVELHLVDPSGTTEPTVRAVHQDTQDVFHDGPAHLVSGDTEDGVYRAELVIPQGTATGPVLVTVADTYDLAGNLRVGGPVGTVALVAPDLAGPEVGEHSLTPTVADATDGDVEVAVGVRLVHPAGVLAPTVRVVDAEDATVADAVLDLVDGTTEDGTWSAVLTVPQGTPEGLLVVHLSEVEALDGGRTEGEPLGEVLLARPVLAGTPVVTGTPRVGSRLEVDPGTWSPEGVTLAYQWLRAGTPVPGATASSYPLAAADAGATVSVRVTGTRAGRTASRTSAGVRVESVLTATPAPTVSGGRDVGATLTAVPGTWGPGAVTLTYRWTRDGTAITGATGRTYTLTKADAGRSVRVAVTGSRTGYTPVTRTSGAVTVNRLLTATPRPTVTGTPRVGKKLTASAGTWGPAPVTLAYTWKRDGKAISGATSRTYTLTAKDAGRAVTVTVTGRRSGYTSASTTSAAVRVEKQLTATPTPTVTGTARVGKKLTASAGTWKPAPVTLTYTWKRDGKAISGARSRTYTLTKKDAGRRITVTVTGARKGYTSVSRTSKVLTVRR